jgi:hypothetical protein
VPPRISLSSRRASDPSPTNKQGAYALPLCQDYVCL